MKKKTIAVVFGGRSAEHDVSIITAYVPVINALAASGNYDSVPVYIAKDGRWYSRPDMKDIAFFKQPAYEDILTATRPLELSLDGGLTLIWPSLFGKRKKIDVVFPTMHGTYGEDGSLMGLLRLAGVPFVGCDMTASAVAMDKVLTKQVCAAEGLPVVPYVWFTRFQWKKDADSIRERIATLSYPLFVKPVHLGSSIGITKAKDAKQLENAIEVALQYDEKVLVEEGVQNLIEVTLPMMGNEDITFAHVERPMNKTDFFDFNDKYLSGGGKKGGASGVNNAYSEIPAAIGDELTSKVKEIGARVYTTLGCEGIARVDFLIDSEKNALFVNEVNTLPGSLYHHNWKQAGVTSMALVENLIRLAQERAERQKETTHTFRSGILSKVGGAKLG